MTRSRGFTLLELMITIAIVAILAAIAVPSYSEYLRRSRITEAFAALSGMRVKMEQFYQDNRTYAGACVGGTVAPLPSTPNFTYLCPAANLTATTYLVTATGNVGTSVEGFTYTINDQNVRTSAMVPPSTWPNSGVCWVTKKDGSC